MLHESFLVEAYLRREQLNSSAVAWCQNNKNVHWRCDITFANVLPNGNFFQRTGRDKQDKDFSLERTGCSLEGSRPLIR